jgi:hypothetical protein
MFIREFRIGWWGYIGREFGVYVQREVNCWYVQHGVRCRASTGETRWRAENLPIGPGSHVKPSSLGG